MSSRSAPTDDLRDLLEFLKSNRGFDFSGYKRTTVARRIDKRMQAVGAESYAEYEDFLEFNPNEFTELFNTLLINVTSFFRDAPAWDFMRQDVIPALIEAKRASAIRVWSAGCASGEEAYTIAMLLAEALGEDAFRERVKIYATDLDEDALQTARHAVYSADALKPVPGELVERYFEPNATGLCFRADLRRNIIFGRNDLVADAPISRVDLLVCRNVLMYFTRDTQSRALERFNFALNANGFLFLGKSEMLITHGELFEAHSLKWRVFNKVPRQAMRDRIAQLPANMLGRGEPAYADLRAGAAALAPTAQIVVDRRGMVAEVNQRARELFSLGPADLGRPFQDLAVSYRPVDLRSAVEKAYELGKPVTVGNAELPAGAAGERILEIVVTPVPGHTTDEGIAGAAISFADVTALARLTEEHRRTQREVETAYEELQSTVEELETTNEELQSTNEELETTNEELQSTNEELETMNEELQSSNDELETMNSELNSRAEELDRVTLFLEGILASLGVGVAVVDRDRKVQIWNAKSEDLWGVRGDEAVGKDFGTLDFGLPLADVTPLIDTVLDGGEESAQGRVEAVNRRGRSFTCSVRVMTLTIPGGEKWGALILTAPAGDDGPAATD